MKILRSIKRLRAAWKLTGGFFDGTNNPFSESLSGLYGTRMPRKTDQALLGYYSGLVFALANINARAFASVPLRLYATTRTGQLPLVSDHRTIDRKRATWLRTRESVARRMDKAVDTDEITDHPVLDLLFNVNSKMNRYQLFFLSDLYQEILGTAYWRIVSGGVMSLPREIWILPTHQVTAVQDPATGWPRSYQYKPGQAEINIPAPQIIAFKFPSLKNPYLEGLSPAEAGWDQLNILSYTARHTLNELINPFPAVIGTPKSDEVQFDPDSVVDLEREIRRKFARAMGVAIISEAVDLKPLTITSRNMEKTAHYKTAKEALCNIFDVPVPMLETAPVNRATLEAAQYQHTKYGILPRCLIFEETLNQFLAPFYGDRFFFAFDNPVIEDRQAIVAVQNLELASGKRTINEQRAEDGDPPVPWGDKPWIPIALAQPLDEDVEPPFPPPAFPPPPAPEAAPDDELLPDEGKSRALYRLLIRAAESPNLRPAVVKQIEALGFTSAWALAAVDFPPPPKPAHVCGDRDAEWTHPEWHRGVKAPGGGHHRRLPDARRLEMTLRTLFRRQRSNVFERLRGWQLRSAKDLAAPLDLSDWDDAFVRASRPAIQIQAEHGARDVVARLGLTDEAWAVINLRVREAAEKLTLSFCQATNASTTLQLNTALDKLRHDLATGIVTGDNTLPALTRIVNGVFENATRYKARQIAATESSRAVHMGQVMQSEASGVVTGIRWLLSADACEICQAIAAEHPEVGLGESFARVGDHPEYSNVEYPPAHPNCRCTITEILKE